MVRRHLPVLLLPPRGVLTLDSILLGRRAQDVRDEIGAVATLKELTDGDVAKRVNWKLRVANFVFGILVLLYTSTVSMSVICRQTIVQPHIDDLLYGRLGWCCCFGSPSIFSPR